MSKIILCTSKQAKTPFVFLNTKVEIYTYEELCFYIFNNTVLISKTTLSDKLVSWIREELGMDALADRLAGLLNKSVSAQDILIEILTAGDYYSADEIHDYSAAWQKYRKFSPDHRLKLKADAYLGYRRYIKAATLYDTILDREEEIDDKVFIGNVLHNRAVAAANNLETDDAKAFFLRAYSMNGNEESLREYFYMIAVTSDTATLRSEIRQHGLDDEFFETIMSEIGDSKDDVREMTIFTMLQRAVYNRLNKNMTDYDKRMDIILGELKDDFREQAI